jgi:hypothetical protein
MNTNKLIIAFSFVMLILTGMNCYITYLSGIQNDLAAAERDLIIEQNDVIVRATKTLIDGDLAMMRRMTQVGDDQTAILGVQKNIADFITKGY